MTEEIDENRSISAAKIANEEFDVYFSYNKESEEDLEHIKEISKWLQDNGLAPWRPEWDTRPGKPERASRERSIKGIASSAVFMGQAGFDQRLSEEVDVLLNEFTDQRTVIPVYLPNAPSGTQFPSYFLRRMAAIDFRKTDPDPLEYLIRGITGKRPTKVYRPGVLVASLGDSPMVVSSMYELLREKKRLTLDRVEVLAPKREETELAREFINEALKAWCNPEYEILDFEDANSSDSTCEFLQRLYRRLELYQQRGDSVYLSLAGGRKSMGALMAWVAPFFSCIRGLYHVIDKDEEHLLSTYAIIEKSSAQRARLMHPALDTLTLIPIPFDRAQHIGKQRLQQLLASSLADDERVDPEKAEALITGQTIVQESMMPKVCVTNLVIKQFHELSHQHPEQARIVRNGLMEMGVVTTLQEHQPRAETYRLKVAKMHPINLHYLTNWHEHVRPVFYTRPGDIYDESGEQIERIVICSLEREGANGYRTLKEVTKSAEFSVKYSSDAAMLPPIPTPAQSVLIVPLGKSPMIATQLYTLLTEQEQHTIHEVVLIYPEDEEIVNGARLIQRAFADKHIPYKSVCIRGLRDIKSKEDCELYQSHLESEIDRVQQEYPKYKIDLALSGGRKGMTAMTIFAAQKKRIRYVYHTLITNEDISEQIEEETTFAALNKTSLSQQTMYDRLFLEAYKAEGPYPYKHFTLFRVPVFSPDGW